MTSGPVRPMLSLETCMNEELSSGFPGGVVAALDTLRHALADPLSAVGLKLELVQRRLAALSPDEALLEKLRGAKADLAVAGRFIDLLPRLARIVGEAPEETSLGDLCRAAGAPLEEEVTAMPRLRLRRQASIEALRAVVSLLTPPGSGGRAPRLRAEIAPGRISLQVEALDERCASNPESLFHLPRGEERAGELFLARAGVETDGGTLDLVEQEGRPVAFFSWPRPPAPRDGEAPD